MKPQITPAKNNESIPRLAYTPEECGQAVGRHASWIYRKIYDGSLRVSASFGKRAMVSAKELERFVNELGTYEVRNIGRRAHKGYRESTTKAVAQ